MKKIVSAVICLVFVLSLTSCAGEKYSRTDVTVFDTETVITGYAPTEGEFDRRADEITEVLTEYHRLYDIYNEYEGMNNLKTVNAMAGKEPVKVNEKIIDLIEFSKKMYELTGGRTNIAIGAVTKIWHEYREEGVAVPTEEELKAAAEHIDINSITYSREEGTVFITDPETSVDVGAVAKGFAAERAAELIVRRGWDNMALSVGGNVRTVGNKGDGKPWVTGIQNPGVESLGSVVTTVDLCDLSCVTSGSYQRYYEVDGVRYHHIIDPETLFPENRYLSVSVICKDSGMADALSTALFNMSEEEGRAALERAHADGIWIYPDGTVARTEGAE